MAENLTSQTFPDLFSWNGCKYFHNGYQFISPDTSCHNTSYELIFTDEFDSTTLNTLRWQTAYPWGRSLKKPTSETGWEKQFYTDENAYVSDGTLKLRTVYEPSVRTVPLSLTETAFFGYTSGMIYSKQGFSAGKYEIRCKIPKIEGLFPAFWMYGFCGQEIDVFEFLNDTEISDASIDGSKVVMTYHRSYDCQVPEKDKCESPYVNRLPTDMSFDYHIYSVEWNEFKIVWRVDNQVLREVYKYWELNSSPGTTGFSYAFPVKSCKEIQAGKSYTYFDPFPTKEYPMHVIVNTAVLKDRAQSSGVLPAEFEIDYIKIYKEISLPERYKQKTNFVFYPNPSTGKISLKTNSKDFEIIKITNALGVPVSFNFIRDINEFTIELNQARGVYFINYSNEGEIYTQKIVVGND